MQINSGLSGKRRVHVLQKGQDTSSIVLHHSAVRWECIYLLSLHRTLQTDFSCYPESPETASDSRKPSAPWKSPADFRAGVAVSVLIALVHASTTFPHSIS